MIVVGCGPAGATAARVAAERGLSVMIVDRRRSIGAPPRCGGYVPAWLRPRTAFDDSAILQEVDGIRLVGGVVREIIAPGFILDRTRFDKNLAIHALEAGADLAQALVLRREGMRVVGRRNGLVADFSAQFIVGADGPYSIVGRSVGLANQHFLATMQYEVGMRVANAWLEFHHLEGEIAWFVPCGRTARIGVGVPRARARQLKSLLNHFLAQQVADGCVFDGVLSCTGGLLPINGPLESARAGHVLLTGDAGGFSEPFSGAGIASAVVGGELAGDLIGEAINQPDVLGDYDTELKTRMPEGFSGYAPDVVHLTDRLSQVATWCPPMIDI